MTLIQALFYYGKYDKLMNRESAAEIRRAKAAQAELVAERVKEATVIAKQQNKESSMSKLNSKSATVMFDDMIRNTAAKVGRSLRHS